MPGSSPRWPDASDILPEPDDGLRRARIFLSNSHALELIGWRAICIEPHPEYFEHCRRNRPDARCIQAACVGDSVVRQVDFFADDLGV